MKKLLILFISLFAFLAVHSQSATVISYKPTAVTVSGVGTATITLPQISGEYDVSLQMIPATAGAGDSLNFSHVLYLSDSYDDNAWSSVSSADSVDTATDSDGIAYWADMKSLRIKAICTGLSIDTITIQPYVVYKKHAQE